MLKVKWERVHADMGKDYEWAAMDADGQVYAYSGVAPHVRGTSADWGTEGGGYLKMTEGVHYTKFGETNWKKSLVKYGDEPVTMEQVDVLSALKARQETLAESAKSLNDTLKATKKATEAIEKFLTEHGKTLQDAGLSIMFFVQQKESQ